MTPRRGAILREMGLAPVWRLRTSVDNETHDAVAQIEPERPPESAAHPVDTRTLNTAQAERDLPRHEKPGAPPGRTSSNNTQRTHAIAEFDWTELESDIRNCSACVLCEKRRQAVPGTGDRTARWMFVGEGPGADEDRLGEPFVGQAGKLLDNMLAAVGLSREREVYIANAVKCRPPHNRTPEADEIAACLPYLKRQIDLVKPAMLIALGRPAAKALLNRDISIGAERGKLHTYQGIPVIISYHPAYLLRNPQDKGKAWEDLCFARRQLGA